ncbi:MAG: GGDEF domain-containing phosphodiesterase [Roseiarcus sp.]
MAGVGSIMSGSRKFSGSRVELLTVVSICVVLLFLEWRFGVLSAAAALLSHALPSGKIYFIAVGGALWIGMAVYSLRRRHELSREVNAFKALQSEFEVAVITDKMTGLPNRHGLETYLTAMTDDRADDHDLMLIGALFSNLKMIANVQGFEIANAIAMDVTNRLVDRVRVPDLVAGVNGEQFYVLLHGEGGALTKRATALIDYLVANLRSINLNEGPNLPLALHIGVANLSLCPTNAKSPMAAEMIRRCDLAVHEAAQRGAGAVVFFDATMERSIDQRGVIEASLDEAIRSGQIEPHFQPLINLSDGSIAGFEVLARWKHPALGQIPPSTFIPIATESGRLEELTLAFLDRACRAAIAWAGSFSLAFNISPKSLNNEGFLNDFVRTLKATQFPPSRVEVEITEDAFVHDAFSLSKPIGKLKSEGISLAIDDFGTGYSSLRHLLILPFDKIKIDQSFVRDMIENPESRKIVHAIIGLGRSMGLSTVAEGIEVEEQRAILRELGCQIGQGYLFAKAMPAERAASFVRARSGVATGRPNLPNPRELDMAS